MVKLKYVFTVLCLVILTSQLSAQDLKIKVQNTREGNLILEDFPGNLPIEGYSGNEIIVTSLEEFKTTERSKGLKPIYPGGIDNTGLGISMEKNGSRITLHCLLPITHRGEYKIKVPEIFSLKIKRMCGNSGETSIKNFKNEIEFNGCSSVKLINVTGPLVINTISGNIDVVFSKINKDKPISLTSVSGEVDVSIPPKASVDLEMSTVSGKMYSDFDLTPEKKGMRAIGGSNLQSKLNGGGTDLKIHIVSGNIYLRKGKSL